MEALFEILFQFLGEFLLQFLFEAISDIGFEMFDKTAANTPRPILWALGCLTLGTLAGGISLLILPHSMITTPSLWAMYLLGRGQSRMLETWSVIRRMRLYRPKPTGHARMPPGPQNW